VEKSPRKLEGCPWPSVRLLPNPFLVCKVREDPLESTDKLVMHAHGLAIERLCDLTKRCRTRAQLEIGFDVDKYAS
jgi:hypothetical protein